MRTRNRPNALRSGRGNGAARDERGFGLVEALVAMVLVIIFFVIFGQTFGGALRNSAGNRLRQQATSIAMQELEFGRSLTYIQLAMSSVDPSAPMLDASQTQLLASESGLAADEPLVIDGAGLVAPSGSETIDGQQFQVWRYVTQAQPGLKRLVVLIEWEVGGADSSFQASTLISQVGAT
ncbi:MAG: hypothetical protein ACE5KX_03165 [Acidimicrobiia bacterium]